MIVFTFLKNIYPWSRFFLFVPFAYFYVLMINSALDSCQLCKSPLNTHKYFRHLKKKCHLVRVFPSCHPLPSLLPFWVCCTDNPIISSRSGDWFFLSLVLVSLTWIFDLMVSSFMVYVLFQIKQIKSARWFLGKNTWLEILSPSLTEHIFVVSSYA